MMSDYKNYALALFELAKEENKTDVFLKQITQINNIFAENKDYFKIFSSPAISETEKTALINEAFKETEPTLKKFILFIAVNSALHIFPKVAKGFEELCFEEEGVLCVNVTSAVSLTEEEKNKLSQRLSCKTGKKIKLRHIVDEGLIGGAVLSYNGKEFDGSIKNKLLKLKKSLI